MAKRLTNNIIVREPVSLQMHGIKLKIPRDYDKRRSKMAVKGVPLKMTRFDGLGERRLSGIKAGSSGVVVRR